MKLLGKIFRGLLVLLVLVVVVGAFMLSNTSDCGPLRTAALNSVVADVPLMTAVRTPCYGSPDDMLLAEFEKPVAGDDEVLVNVKAASVNPLDWHYLRGLPYFMRLMSGLNKPDDLRSGVDFAGVVEAIGKNVSQFKVGDRVFGGRSGAFGEYLVIPEDRAITHIPDNVSFEEAAAVPIAGVTAIQALRDLGQIKAGYKVLVNGASGGVGTYAVQIAKSFGAEVTGVSSQKNHAMVKALGADHMIDYKSSNYTENGEKYDIIIDNIGNHSFGANTKVLTPDGKLVMIGGAKGDWIGPMINPIKALFTAPFVDQEFIMIMAEMRADDLGVIAGLMGEGKVRSQIDRQYSLKEVPEAIRYSESGRARGKIIINMQ